MARHNHIPIFQKTYALTLHIYKMSSGFKLEYKYTLGERLKIICHDLLDLIVIVNSKNDKREVLEKLDNKLENLRIHLRLAFDLKILSSGHLGVLNKQIEEIGRQIGGWQNWAEKNIAPPAPASVSMTQGFRK